MNGADSQPEIVLTASADAGQRFASGRAFTVIALVLLSFGACWPGTLSLMASWEDTVGRTYTHGYVVVVLALWMIWRDRMSWTTVPARPFLPAVALLFAGALGWLVAYRAGLQIVHQAALPAFAASAVLVMFGWRTLRALAFPLAWLYLAIPIWDAVRPLLNWISVMAVRLLLRIADIPAYFVNNTFEIPSGTFAIADGCSGLHFFVVALTISLLYGEINRDNLRTRVKLVLFALVLAMATNWLRIFIIVLAGHLTDMQHRLVVNEHYSFGWYMFAGMMTLYFLIVRRWPAAPTALPEATAPAGEMLPRRGALVAALGLAVTPAWLFLDANVADDAQLVRAMRADVALQQSDAASDWQPRFAGATRESRGVLHAVDTPVEVYVAGYLSQRQGEELIGFGNSLLGEQLLRAPSPAPAPAPWTELQAVGATDHWVIWYAYRLDGRWYRSPLRLQLDYGIQSLSGAPAAAVIALRARCGAENCVAARESLKQIAETRYP
jgi:exosortase A